MYCEANLMVITANTIVCAGYANNYTCMKADNL